MQTRLNPSRVRFLASLLAIGFGVGAGCATSPGGYGGATSNSSYLLNKVYVIVEAPANMAADIFIDGEMVGPTPVHLRLDANETGGLLRDVELVARWSDGRNETSFSLREGSRLPAAIRVNPSGLLNNF